MRLLKEISRRRSSIYSRTLFIHQAAGFGSNILQVEIMQEDRSPSAGKRFDWRTRPYRPPLISSHYYSHYRDHTHYSRDHTHYYRGSHSLNPSPTHSSHYQIRQSRSTWTPPPPLMGGDGCSRYYHSHPSPSPSNTSRHISRDSYRRDYPPRGDEGDYPRRGYRREDISHRGDGGDHPHRRHRGNHSPRGDTPHRRDDQFIGRDSPHRGDNSPRRDRGGTPHRQGPSPRRPRIYANDYLRDSHKRRYPLISLVSYNLLAQDLLQKNMHLYRTNDPVYLQWEHRKTRLLREILNTHADICCFQEVQEEHFFDWYYPELNAKGYEGIFQKRTGHYSDGCAIFYKSHKLQVVEHQKVQFQKNTGTMVRDNVAIIIKFTLSPQYSPSSTASKTFCIATTHLLFNHKAGEIKLAQMCYLLAELHKMAATRNSVGETVLLPSVVCGDFNCLPNSPMLDFVLGSKLDYSNLDASHVTGYMTSLSYNRLIPVPLIPSSFGISQECMYTNNSNSESSDNGRPSDDVEGTSGLRGETSSAHKYTDLRDKIQSGSKGVVDLRDKLQGGAIQDSRSSSVLPPCPKLTHPFTFHSGYPMLKEGQHSPTATTYHRSACETVDYILYTPTTADRNRSSGFHLVSRTALPSQHVLHQYGPQPNHVFSSDHLYLQVDLQLI